MNHQQFLESLKKRKEYFETLRDCDMRLPDVIELLEQIEKDANTLTLELRIALPRPPSRIYLSTFEDRMAISSVAGDTSMDEWEKRTVEVKPSCNRLSDTLTVTRNVLSQAGIEVVMED